MVTPPNVLAVVQARGGSKGLPNKNLLPLCGHPLVAYAVTSALRSVRVTRTIISTDSPDIAAVAREYGAEAPFLRPEQISVDDAPDLPLFQHALDWLARNEGYRPDILVQLRPTTPLRPRGLLDEAIQTLQDHPDADCVRAVTAPAQTPYKMWRADPKGFLEPLLVTGLPEPYNMPRQSLPPVLWQTGHVDVIRASTIREQQSLTGQRVWPIAVTRAYCIDIDSAADFEAAARAIEVGGLELDLPTSGGATGAPRGQLPDTIELLVFDFDGVFTDNRVLVLEDGREAVACDRGDGMGISLLRRSGVPMVVLSTEENPVVAARCRKLELSCIHGLSDKATALRRLIKERGVDPSRTIFVGNDVNDLACLREVGCAVVPADAHPEARAQASMVLRRSGGYGAVRELCDAILVHLKKMPRHDTDM